jgi:hypothetical protein
MPIRVRIPETVVCGIRNVSAICSGGEAQPPQRGDRLDAVLGRAVVDVRRRRGAIEQAELALGLETAHQLAGGALAGVPALFLIRAPDVKVHRV